MCFDGGVGGPVIFGYFVLYFSLNLGDEVRFSFTEKRVVVVVVVFVSFFGEAIHVELSDEGMHVPMLEVLRKHNVYKTILAANYESIILLIPSNNMTVLGFLNRWKSTCSI